MLRRIAKKIPFSFDYICFVGARVAGIAIKPVILMYFLKLHYVAEAATLSKAFLALASFLVLYSVPVHFDFYKLYFDKEHSFLRLRGEFDRYLVQLVIHCLLITPIALGIMLLTSRDIWFSVLIVALLISEKVFDEIQRFLQFAENFRHWSIYFLSKNLLPFFAAILYSLYFPKSDYFFLGAMIVFCLVSSAFLLPPFVLRRLVHSFRKINATTIWRYVRDVRSNYGLKYLQGISSANLLNAHRWVVSILFPPLFFSELTVVSQFCNGVSIGTGNLALAHRRKQLLKSNNALSTLFFAWRLPVIVAGLSLFVFGLLATLQSKILEMTQFDLTFATVILGGYAAYSLSESLIEYLFWNGNLVLTLLIDGVFYCLVIVSAVVLGLMHHYLLIAPVLCGAAVLRLLMQIAYTSRVVARHGLAEVKDDNVRWSGAND